MVYFRRLMIVMSCVFCCRRDCCAGRASESNGKASFVSEDDRAIEAAQAGDIAAMQAFLDRGGYIELRDSRIGMVIKKY